MPKYINRKLSTSVHKVAKMLSIIEECSVSDIARKAVEQYTRDYPDNESLRSAPRQNPLIYPTESTSISLCISVRDYLKTLPSSDTKSSLDRVIIHYQNFTSWIQPPLRKTWLDPEHTNWADTIPED